MRPSRVFEVLTGRLVVSCQADETSPLADPSHITALARAVVMGGAAGLRIQGVDNLRSVRAAVTVPIIGIVKTHTPGSDVYITARVAEIEALAAAGADIIAFDATDRPRPESVTTLCAAVHRCGCVAMADISTADEGAAAIAAGADFVGTTLSGYTPYSRRLDGPDFELMSELAARAIPFVAEGRFWTADDVRQALDRGARFVVVGSAITRPDDITRRFVRLLGITAPSAGEEK